ncbi:MAG TPA: capsule assembly Wzi family protein [Longimicrobiales bacterium]|nr:capsule assembly Wzi family protein [Longimicrobiales bacterium]
MMRSLLTALLILTSVLSAPLAAQDASPFVPADHWSVGAVNRLHALGLTPPGTVRGQRSRTVGEVRSVLEEAAAGGHELARGYLRRFADEFSGDSATFATLTHATVAAGAGVLDGDVRHGVYRTWGEENWTGTRPLNDRTTGIARGALLATLGGHVAAGAVATRNPVHTRVSELYGTVRLGPVGIWGGRRVQGFGPGTGGIVLDGNAPVDGGGLFVEPVRLPWLLRHLGPVRAELGVAPLPANGPVDRPFFILTRGSIEPHPRIGFGITRAGMIGASDDGRSVGDILYFLVGGQTGGSEYDNQIAAADAWFRPPAGPLPLLLYVEWGAEDSAGAWWDVPGIVAGVELAAVPRLPWLSVVIERSSFERSASGNPPWYRHPIGFHDGWSTRDELLGHPLGGHGREWLLQARADLMDGRLQLVTRGFTRRRGSENVFAPERAGLSNGVAVRGDLQLRSGFVLHVEGATEDGGDWRRTQASGALRFYLPRVR